MKKLAKAKALIIDDLGLTPMSSSERRDLLEVIEDRHGLSSTVVVTQLPIDRWHDKIKEATIADAILDRLVHNAHKINLKGDSMRKLRSTLTKEKNSEK
jgi:DNA replication protein DnaC